MNDVIKCILTRRSIRKFSSEMVNDEDIRDIVKAGEFAPSAMGKQERIIVVIKDKKVRDELKRLNASIMGRFDDFDPFYNAPVVIIVLAKKDSPTRQLDGAASIENMLLAANSLSLGTCWVHRAKEEFETAWGKNLLLSLGITEEMEGIDHIALGYYKNEDVGKAKERRNNSVFYI